MRFILIWFFLSLVVAVLAQAKGRSVWNFFWLAMLASPAIGFLAVLLIPPSEEVLVARGLKSGKLKKCSSCARIVSASGPNCSYCHRPLPVIIDVETIDAKED